MATTTIEAYWDTTNPEDQGWYATRTEQGEPVDDSQKVGSPLAAIRHLSREEVEEVAGILTEAYPGAEVVVRCPQEG